MFGNPMNSFSESTYYTYICLVCDCWRVGGGGGGDQIKGLSENTY